MLGWPSGTVVRRRSPVRRATLVEHLPGKHDQKAHGRKGGRMTVTVPAGALAPGTKLVYGGGIPWDFDSKYPGVTLRGDEVISPNDPRIPDTVYHVTTNLPAVQRAGFLDARGEGGLGGDRSDQIVSMTIDRGVARQLAADMRFHGEVAGLSPGRALSRMQEQADAEGWGGSLRTEIERGGTAYSNYTTHDYEGLYYSMRSTQKGTKNPVFMGDSRPDPAKVGVIAIPARNLDNGALLVDFDLSNPMGLREIRSYGDVSIEGGEFFAESLIEHLVGQHDQRKHGHRGGIPSPAVMQERAKRVFGVTDDIAECGYITPDGTMLDFSGRHYASGYHRQGDRFVPDRGQPDYLAGERNVDHREVGAILPEVRGTAEYGAGALQLATLVRDGGFVRASPLTDYIGLELSGRLTGAQFRTLAANLGRFESIVVDQMGPDFRIIKTVDNFERPDRSSISILRQFTEALVEHLPGKHNQKAHGRGLGLSDAAALRLLKKSHPNLTSVDLQQMDPVLRDLVVKRLDILGKTWPVGARGLTGLSAEYADGPDGTICALDPDTGILHFDTAEWGSQKSMQELINRTGRMGLFRDANGTVLPIPDYPVRHVNPTYLVTHEYGHVVHRAANAGKPGTAANVASNAAFMGRDGPWTQVVSRAYQLSAMTRSVPLSIYATNNPIEWWGEVFGAAMTPKSNRFRDLDQIEQMAFDLYTQEYADLSEAEHDPRPARLYELHASGRVIRRRLPEGAALRGVPRRHPRRDQDGQDRAPTAVRGRPRDRLRAGPEAPTRLRRVAEHLAGKHDQRRHGRKGAGGFDPRRPIPDGLGPYTAAQQQDAVRAWQSSFEMCQDMKAASLGVGKVTAPMAEAFREAVMSQPTVSGAVYKGINARADQFKVGARVEIKTFESTSPDLDTAVRFGDTLFEITGGSAHDIRSMSRFPDFAEAVLEPGRFGVVGIREGPMSATSIFGPVSPRPTTIVSLVALPEWMP